MYYIEELSKWSKWGCKSKRKTTSSSNIGVTRTRLTLLPKKKNKKKQKKPEKWMKQQVSGMRHQGEKQGEKIIRERGETNEKSPMKASTYCLGSFSRMQGQQSPWIEKRRTGPGRLEFPEQSNGEERATESSWQSLQLRADPETPG